MFDKIFNRKKETSSFNPAGELAGVHIAMLATDGFEQSELFEPKKALEEEGAIVHVISLKPGRIKAWNKKDWGKTIQVDMTVREAWTLEFDALVLPGGVLNPDKLRESSEAVSFVMSFINKKRPVAAICHGVQTLIETNTLKGKRLTSYPSVKTDVLNAGGEWIDREVVVDQGLITSRKPSDIPAFNRAMIREFSEGRIQHGLTDSQAYSMTF